MPEAGESFRLGGHLLDFGQVEAFGDLPYMLQHVSHYEPPELTPDAVSADHRDRDGLAVDRVDEPPDLGMVAGVLVRSAHHGAHGVQ